MPESSNHSLFPENERNFGGNKLQDGSIGLSPLRRKRTICPSTSKRAFARDSPDFAFFRHFPGFLRALLSLKPLSRSRSVASVHVCVRVCGCVLCMLCAVLCYICSKNMKKSINMENKTRLKSWSQRSQNMVSLFWHDMAIHGPKKSPENGHFPRRIVFLRFSWELPTILARSRRF